MSGLDIVTGLVQVGIVIWRILRGAVVGACLTFGGWGMMIYQWDLPAQLTFWQRVAEIAWHVILFPTFAIGHLHARWINTWSLFAINTAFLGFAFELMLSIALTGKRRRAHPEAVTSK